MKTFIFVVVFMFSSAAIAAFCDKCKELAFTADVGECSKCKEFTSSGSHKLCRACSTKLGQCEHCAAPLAKPATRKAELSDKSRQLVAKFKKADDRFSLRLTYYGQQDKPYYTLFLSTAELPEQKREAFDPAVAISKEQAHKLIDALAEIGYFDDSMNTVNVRLRRPTGPTYVLTLHGPEMTSLYLDLGWNKAMHDKLVAIQSSLDGETRKGMDLLIARLSGHLKQWEQEKK